MAGWLVLRRAGGLVARRSFCVLGAEGGRGVFYYFASDSAAAPRGFVKFERACCTVRFGAKAGSLCALLDPAWPCLAKSLLYFSLPPPLAFCATAYCYLCRTFP